MSIWVKLMPPELPVFVRREILAELYEATVDAFECPAPAYAGLSYPECLRTYAQFTAEQAERALKSGRDLRPLEARLYGNARPLGGKVRRWLGVNTLGEVMQVGRVLYRAIGVEMQGDAHGQVTVNRCYFSQFYSGAVCRLISALDDGVFAGLSGGWRLAFSARLTEGGGCCRAKLQARKGLLI